MVLQTCTVPMNFGRHYLELRGLNDLQLICSGGEVVRTSSFPLAINSLVVSELVGELQMKELDVEEFSHSSVQCFVEACYTGSVILTRENFREVNKLSAVFKVQWMIDNCLKFYTNLCSELTTGSLEAAWFLFQEAGYILKERNNKDLQLALNTSLGELSDLRLALVKDFISRDPNKQEFVYTDLCISLAGRSVTVLFKWLIPLIESKPPPVKLSGVEKKLLTSETLSLCSQEDPKLYQKLVTTMQKSLSNDDLGALFSIFSLVQMSPPTPSRGSKRFLGS